MSYSSCGRSVENMAYERVLCNLCGRKAAVIVSNSQKNPGRLYYGCVAHGWLKWVVPSYNEDDANSSINTRKVYGMQQGSGAEQAETRRRFGAEEAGGWSGFDGDNRQNFGGCTGGCKAKQIMVAMVIFNLALISASLVAVFIKIVRG